MILRTRSGFLLSLMSCAACSGGNVTRVLPGTGASSDRGATRTAQSALNGQPYVTPLFLAINAGGSAVGDFVADTDFVNGTTSYVRGANARIDASAPNAAPEDVYLTYRQSAGSFSYVLKGGSLYGGYSSPFVRLHFAEVLGLRAGQRQFNVTINYAQVLTNFDIAAAAGDVDDKAVVVDVPGGPDQSGTVTITFSPGAAAYPIVQGIELYCYSFSGEEATAISINSGGPAMSGYSSDAFVDGFSSIGSDTVPVDVSAPNSAPAELYATYRTEAKTVSYLVSALDPGLTYYGWLHFEEPQYDGPDQRVMAIAVGGRTIAPAFDIFAEAGTKHKAVALPINGTIGADGTLPITVTGLHGAPAIISGFEFYENNPEPGE